MTRYDASESRFDKAGQEEYPNWKALLSLLVGDSIGSLCSREPYVRNWRDCRDCMNCAALHLTARLLALKDDSIQTMSFPRVIGIGYRRDALAGM